MPFRALLLLLGLLWAPAVFARQWYEHYERGLAAADAGRFSEALVEFEEAAKLEPKPRQRLRTYGRQFLVGYDPAYQRARCLAELGRTDEARVQLGEAQAAAVTAPELLAALEAKLRPVPAPTTVPPSRPVPQEATPERTSSEPTPPKPEPAAVVPPPAAVGRLAVRSTPPGARLSIDGRERGTTPVTGLELPPGKHRVRLESEGRESWEQVVTLVAGEPLGLEVVLAPVSPPNEAERPVGEPLPPPTLGLTDQPELETQAPPTDPVEPRKSSARLWVLLAAVVAIATALLSFGLSRPKAPMAPALAFSGHWHLQLLGSRLSDYELEGELGRGGMATTFSARRRRDGRVVALKVPHPTGDATYRERFLREGRLGEALHHPAIVRIFEAGEDRGVPFLAMERIEGQTLKAALAGFPQGMPAERVLGLARALAEALDYAHGKGVVHRDLKPENVMLTPDGGIKVMDFGVARLADQPGLTTSEFFLGSPLYAAPEAVEPHRISPRSDLYSLGILLYEAATGQLPFVHESVYKLLELHQHQPLPNPASLPRPVVLPEPLWRVIEKLCAKRPEDRFASAQALLVELSRLLSNHSFDS